MDDDEDAYSDDDAEVMRRQGCDCLHPAAVASATAGDDKMDTLLFNPSLCYISSYFCLSITGTRLVQDIL